MYFSNCDLVISTSKYIHILNIINIHKKFKSNLIISSNVFEKYNILEDIYINTLNGFKKIESIIFIKNVKLPMYLYNQKKQYLSNIYCFYNNKIKFKSTITNNSNIQSIIQLNKLPEYKNESEFLNFDYGLIIGNWILNKSIQKINNDKYITLLNSNINTPNYISIYEKKINNQKILIDINLYSFVMQHFKFDFPLFMYYSSNFIDGFVCGLILSNMKITLKKYNNLFIIINFKNKQLIKKLQFILDYKFNCNSIIINDDILLQLNNNLFDFLNKYSEILKIKIPKQNFNLKIYNNFDIIQFKKLKFIEMKEVPAVSLNVNNYLNSTNFVISS